MASEDSKALSDARSGRAAVPLAPIVALSVALTLGALFLVGPLLWSVVPETRPPRTLPEPPPGRGDADLHRGLRAADAGGGRGRGAGLGPDRDGTQRGLPLGGGRGAERGPGPGGRAHAGLGWGLLGWWAGGARGGGQRSGGRWRSSCSHEPRRNVRGPPRDERGEARERRVDGRGRPARGGGTGLRRSRGRLARGLLIGAVGVAGVLFVHERVRLPTVPTWLGHTIDIVLRGPAPAGRPQPRFRWPGRPGTSLDHALIQFHQNFFLDRPTRSWPATRCWSTCSRSTGSGSIYFLAGAFRSIPISNGTLGLIEGGSRR